MKRVALFINLLIALNAWSQQGKFTITINPLALADFVNFPTIQAGIETKFSDRIGWYNEIGIRYINRIIRDAGDTSNVSPYGFKLKTEFRYYFGNSSYFKKRYGKKILYNSSGQRYLAANLYFIRDVHNTAVRYYQNRDTAQLKLDNFGVKKTIWGINFIYGRKRSFGDRFQVDLYVGPGIRFRYISTVDKQTDYLKDGFITPIDINVNSILQMSEIKSGFDVVPDLSLGIRLCYRL